MRRLLLALTALLGSATAFVASPLASTLHRSTAFIDQPLLAQKAQLQLQPQWPQRAGIISQSALVLPVVYSGCAATLAVRATHAATRGDVAVLVSLAALALIDLGPTAAAQLASAKRAVEANNGPDARSWRNAVRFKIVGQLGSLLFIAGTCRPGRVLLGATALLATSLCFWVLLGGARYRHDRPARSRRSRSRCCASSSRPMASSACSPRSPHVSGGLAPRVAPLKVLQHGRHLWRPRECARVRRQPASSPRAQEAVLRLKAAFRRRV